MQRSLPACPSPGTATGAARWIAVTLLLTLAACAGTARETGSDFDAETRRIAEALELRPGMTVADIGAGSGRYAAFLAERVGPAGKVYATEITDELLDAIRATVAGKQNVTVVLGSHDSTELPDDCCDRILLRRVYHHFHHRQRMLGSIHASLKPGGVIAVVDFLRAQADMGRPDATPHDHEHGVRIEELIRQMRDAGFELVRQVPDWPGRVRHGRRTDFCVLFRRPD